MNIGITGLGLIGGSLAKTYRQAGWTIYAFDKNNAVMETALRTGLVKNVLDKQTISLCDALFIAVNPRIAVQYLESIAPNIASATTVLDCCGVKRFVCKRCFPLAEQYGFTFVGGHPMAGSHRAGFENSRADLFYGASMIVVFPPNGNLEQIENRVRTILQPVGFSCITVTSAEQHDEMIAFTSQMAHVVSNAYIKSPLAQNHRGFSAGSYKDLTRVAKLNPEMWAELCTENKDYLVKELDGFLRAVTKYRDALESMDENLLKQLLEEGNRLKRD